MFFSPLVAEFCVQIISYSPTNQYVNYGQSRSSYGQWNPEIKNIPLLLVPALSTKYKNQDHQPSWNIVSSLFRTSWLRARHVKAETWLRHPAGTIPRGQGTGFLGSNVRSINQATAKSWWRKSCKAPSLCVASIYRPWSSKTCFSSWKYVSNISTLSFNSILFDSGLHYHLDRWQYYLLW